MSILDQLSSAPLYLITGAIAIAQAFYAFKKESKKEVEA